MVLKSTAVGIDLEDVSRFEKYDDIEKASKMNVFTEAELKYCFSKKKPAQHLAARYCAKEATVKALTSFGIKTYYPRIEVIKNPDETPSIKFLEKKYEESIEIALSLTHSKTQAMAMVIAKKLIGT